MWIHPNQSYLGRPIDPDVVARVRGSIAKYGGVRNVSERDHLIRSKAEDRLRKQQAASEEYFAWSQNLKAESAPCFKFPEDPKQGKAECDQYIKQKVKHGLKDLRDKTKEYNSWIEGLREKKERQLQEQFEAKLKADGAFDQSLEARERERMNRDAEIQGRVIQQSEEYWNWLRNMKHGVASRPHSAPCGRDSGVESASSMAAKKKAENEQALRQRSMQYSQWLQNISQPKFKLPFHDFLNREERERRALAVTEKVEEQTKRADEYFEEIRQIEGKHHARAMRSLKKKLEADKNFNAEHLSVAEERHAKQEAKRNQQKAIELESRKKVKEMYERVKSKPLFIETAYSK